MGKNKPTALDVARYFLSQGKKDDIPISNKKLQKLVYYAQAWMLAINHKPIFEDEIEAWIHGPAIPNVYSKFKGFVSDPILFEEDSFNQKHHFSLQEVDILREVWRVYGGYDAHYLEILTHEEAPWIQARNGIEQKESSKNIISHESMQVFYRQKLVSAKKKSK